LAPRRLAGWAAGLLAVYLLLLLGGVIPFSLNKGRVTYLVEALYPVTGSWVLDGSLVSLAVSLVVAGCRGWRPALVLVALLLPASVLLSAAPAWAVAAGLAMLSSYAVSLALSGGCSEGLVDAASAAIILVEALAVGATLAYLASPRRLLRVAEKAWLLERRLWSPVAALAPPLLVAAGTAWLVSTLLPGAAGWVERRLGVLRRLRALAPRGGGGGCAAGPYWLPLAVLYAVFLVAIPHLPTVNPRGLPVSVDTFYYTAFVVYAEKHGLLEALHKFAGMARPLYLACLYALWRLLGVSPFTLFDIIHPVVSGALLAAASLYVARRRGGVCWAGYASVLAVAGGWYATFLLSGFQANSVALPLALLYFAASSWRWLAADMVLTALVHPWTHAVFTAGLALDRLRAGDRGGAARALVLGASALLIAASVSALFGGSLFGSVARPLLNSAQPLPRSGLYSGLMLWSWGSLLAAPWMMLAAASPLYTPAHAVLAATGPMLLFVDAVVVHRLVLDTPLWLAAASLLPRLPRRLRAALLLASLAGGLYAAYSAKPLAGELWWRILAG